MGLIRNRYLPGWMHRLCNGVLGAVVFGALALTGLESCPPGHWAHGIATWLLYLSVPVGVLMAVFAGRFSIAEGIAGGDGNDELVDADEDRNLP